MNSWPREISPAEAIVRGICSPYHIDKKGNLKPDAYRSPPGKDEVSVMRLNWIGADACKGHAKRLEDLAQSKVYRGLAVLSAAQIRAKGANLEDTRKVFEGHADIHFGIAPIKGGPLPPKLLIVLKEIAALARFYPDSDPGISTWTGPPLLYRP